ncbi:MAG: 4-hydroxy-3-methylbut-2-enyl diphosphate reductase [Paludibacteraceae bacterium]|nr:4-hydroxy-3-methylbut-2-enyl diphosphate reductase [Paludibacteraceae bacterium]
MTVTIDENSGFCFGVTTAIETAERELKKGSLYCLGDIVHNGQEVERLDKLGLETIDYDDLRTLRNARVLLRAHGEPPSTYHIAKQNGIEIIDASCPVVLHLQKRIRDTYQSLHGKNTGAQIVIFGKKGHAEVIGLEGQTNNTAIVIESINDLDKLDFSKPIYLFSQTTKSVEEFEAIVEEIKRRKAKGESLFEYHNTICRNVANRVKRLQEFASSNDVVIFVGGQKSSNAKVLYHHCLEVNSCTLFVSSEADITQDILERCHRVERVGICGATSTPKWLMENVKKHIENYGI